MSDQPASSCSPTGQFLHLTSTQHWLTASSCYPQHIAGGPCRRLWEAGLEAGSQPVVGVVGAGHIKVGGWKLAVLQCGVSWPMTSHPGMIRTFQALAFAFWS